MDLQIPRSRAGSMLASHEPHLHCGQLGGDM